MANVLASICPITSPPPSTATSTPMLTNARRRQLRLCSPPPPPCTCRRGLVTGPCARCHVTASSPPVDAPLRRRHPFSTRRAHEQAAAAAACVSVRSSAGCRRLAASLLQRTKRGPRFSACGPRPYRRCHHRHHHPIPSCTALASVALAAGRNDARLQRTVRCDGSGHEERRARTLWCAAPHCNIHPPSSTSPRLWRRAGPA
jgi:hypothetical protein